MGEAKQKREDRPYIELRRNGQIVTGGRLNDDMKKLLSLLKQSDSEPKENKDDQP